MSIGGYDSAFFASPGGAVEFYVLSPQWNGEPSDIALKPETEQYVSEKVENKPDRIQKMGTKSVRWFAIAAKDKSYLRSYIATKNKQLNTSFVMDIKYRDQNVYSTTCRNLKNGQMLRFSLITADHTTSFSWITTEPLGFRPFMRSETCADTAPWHKQPDT